MWPTGWSWTKGHWETTTNPDGTKKELYVCAGPFFFNKNLLRVIFNRFDYRLECYAGMRPTAPWTHGGNEGLIVWFKRLMQKIGCSNLGFAFRLKNGIALRRAK